MDFLNDLEKWARGDARQGRIMAGIGFILIGIFIYILSIEITILRGMLIPLSLLILIYLGYGSFLTFSRINHFKTIAGNYKLNPKKIIEQELSKAKKDHKTYSMLIPIWLILIAVALCLFYIFSMDYYKGLALGLIFLFIGAMLLDYSLHRRLKPYLRTLQTVSKQ